MSKRGPDVLDNTPWWLSDVNTGMAGGVLLDRCNPFGFESGGPTALEGGFYDLRSLGPHLWQCKARADATYQLHCEHGHKGRRMKLCNGHAMMIRKRMSGVCTACVHPPEELALQEAMERIRQDPSNYRAASAVELERNQQRAVSRLWDIQAQLDELVERGIVHRCPLTLREVS